MLDAAVGDADAAPDQIVDRFRQAGDSDDLLLATVERSARQALALEGRPQDTRLRWAMGDAMRTLLGRADPKVVWSHLAEALSIEHEEMTP
jgi:Asp-tRNA(Asn)/Glu-tRNA(Gln) amidotransferase B subunit